MNLDPEQARRLVRASYDRLGRRYSEWARGIHSDARARYTDLALNSLPPRSDILDLGCGDGSLLTIRLAERYRVTGVDISPVQLALARTAIPGARFICADICNLTLPANSFDAITAFYCLTHLPRPELPAILKSIAGWLRPGGLFIASFGGVDQPDEVEPDWIGVPMFFCGEAPDTNRELVVEAGLTIEQDTLMTDIEESTPVTFHWIIARKPGHC